MQSFGRRTSRAGLLLTLGVVAGCGDGRPERLPVSGRVLVDGKPMRFGMIQVTPRGSRAASAVIGPDGRFTLGSFGPDDGCVPGNHPVAVDGRKSLGANRIEWHAPPRFAFAGTSGLTMTVDRPRDDLVLDIQTGGDDPFEPYTEVLSRAGQGQDTASLDTVF